MIEDPGFAVASEDTYIYEETGSESREAGSLAEGALAYVIEDAGDWLFVESADVRGFVSKGSVRYGDEAQAEVDDKGEGAYKLADRILDTDDNKALYYSVSSIKDGEKENPERTALVEMALQCVGNPYVWGGTSLTNGADCSGFVQTLYKNIGYKLPRVAESQAHYGTKIPVEDAKPGDLIFFAKNGYIYHVAMALGDGKTVEAYSSNYGIITHSIEGRSTVWATRILSD